MDSKPVSSLFNMVPPTAQPVSTAATQFGKYGSPDDAHSDEFDDAGALSDGEGEFYDQQDSSAGPKRGGRRPPSTAEKRANHNAIERGRREKLNGHFQELARALPNMNPSKSNSKGPSKQSVVVKALEYVRNTRSREVTYEAQIAQLRDENNELRSRLSMAPRRDSEVHPMVGVPMMKKDEALSHYTGLTPAPAHAFHPAPIPQYPSNGPYLPPDALAAAYYPLNEQRRPSLTGSNNEGGNSDSESSLIQTPPSAQHGFPHQSNGQPHFSYGSGDLGTASAPRSQASYPHQPIDYAGCVTAGQGAPGALSWSHNNYPTAPTALQYYFQA